MPLHRLIYVDNVVIMEGASLEDNGAPNRVDINTTHGDGSKEVLSEEDNAGDQIHSPPEAHETNTVNIYAVGGVEGQADIPPSDALVTDTVNISAVGAEEGQAVPTEQTENHHDTTTSTVVDERVSADEQTTTKLDDDGHVDSHANHSENITQPHVAVMDDSGDAGKSADAHVNKRRNSEAGAREEVHKVNPQVDAIRVGSRVRSGAWTTREKVTEAPVVADDESGEADDVLTGLRFRGSRVSSTHTLDGTTARRKESFFEWVSRSWPPLAIITFACRRQEIFRHFLKLLKMIHETLFAWLC